MGHRGYSVSHPGLVFVLFLIVGSARYLLPLIVAIIFTY